MKATKLFLLALIATAIGCSAGEYSESAQSTTGGSEHAGSTVDKQDGGIPANTSKLVSNQTPAVKRDVVKEGSLTVQVESVDEAEKHARRIAESSGGRVDQVSSTDLAGPSPSIDMTLRIPVGKFESVMEGLEKLGVRMAKKVSVVDVTEKLVDYEARLKTMLAQEEVVRNMLRKSTNIPDSLTIKDDLTRLRGEIESLAGQRKSLAGQAALSTLELKLTQSTTASAVAKTDPNWFQTSWASAWGAGTSTFRSVVSFLMWLLVYAPIWIAFLLACRWVVRALRKALQASASAEGQRPA